MSALRTFAAGACLLSVSALATPATAAGTDEDRARSLFREGVALQDDGNPAAALEKYEAAHALWKNPKIQANLGAAYASLNRYVEAARAYDAFLDATPPGGEGRTAAEEALADVRRKVGTLSVVAKAELSRVTVDGAAVESHFERIRVVPGAHIVEARTGDGRVTRREATVGAGASESVLVQFAEKPAPSASPGPAQQEDTPPASPGALPWIVGGIGVASLAASGAFYLVRSNAVSDLEAGCHSSGVCPGEDASTIDRANRFGVFSAIALGVGVAGVGTGIVLLVTGGSGSDDESGPSATLGISVSGAFPMATASGRF